ncbi:MAG: hypothetical protein Q9224_006071 [Gallowayella concinna]
MEEESLEDCEDAVRNREALVGHREILVKNLEDSVNNCKISEDTVELTLRDNEQVFTVYQETARADAERLVDRAPGQVLQQGSSNVTDHPPQPGASSIIDHEPRAAEQESQQRRISDRQPEEFATSSDREPSQSTNRTIIPLNSEQTTEYHGDDDHSDSTATFARRIYPNTCREREGFILSGRTSPPLYLNSRMACNNRARRHRLFHLHESTSVYQQQDGFLVATVHLCISTAGWLSGRGSPPLYLNSRVAFWSRQSTSVSQQQSSLQQQL